MPPPTPLHELDLATHLADPLRKQRYVTALFDTVAPSYDRFTRVCSFGMDASWKREMLLVLADSVPPDTVVADLACGTGDLAAGARALVPRGGVIALDISRPMLAAARRRLVPQAGGAPARLLAADMMALPLATASVSAVTVGYGFRNVPDVGAAVDEVRRVLRPGGLLLSLDFYLPVAVPWRAAFLGYLRVAGSLAGWLWHREPAAYGYIAPSIRHFVSDAEFGAALRARDFAVKSVRRKLMGGIAIHVARRDQRSVTAGA